MSLDRDIKSSEWEPKGDLDYGSSGLQMSQEITSLKLGGDFGPESQANSILEYTGLTGNKLKTRMKTFRLSVNQDKGLYKEEDIIRKSVLINDPVYGAIRLHPLLESIINTPEFYRLKQVKQLGGVFHVYPGSTHTRFDHSIGASYIAGEFIHHLLQQHPEESKIKQSDILCVKVAGLCHDLGQGPYSHVFEDLIMKNIVSDKVQIPERWCTRMSILIFRKILQDRPKVLTAFVRSGLCKEDVQFIEEMIEHDDDDDKFCPQGRKAEKQRFLYEIVINRKTGIDAVKWDCLFRDCHYLGITINFQWRRLLELSYIVGGKGGMYQRHIGFRNKAVNCILEMFHMQCSLTRKAYKHKTVHAVELMMAEAVILCKNVELIQVYNQKSDLAEDKSICQICDESLLAVKCVSVVEAVESALKAIKEGRPQDNLQGYLALNDLILDQIMNVSLNIREQMFSQKEANSLWSDWKKAHELICRIEYRKLYKLAECKPFSIQRKEVSNEKSSRVKKFQDLIDDGQPELAIARHCKSFPKFNPKDIHVELVKIFFGSEEDKDPLKNVLFVSKDDLSKPNPNEFEKPRNQVLIEEEDLRGYYYMGQVHVSYQPLYTSLTASRLVCPEEFTECELRVFTKKNGLDETIVKDAFANWYGSEGDRSYQLVSKSTHETIGGVEKYECTPEGGTFTLNGHGIQIIVPPGAIEKKIEMEFAVCLDGPFTFPENKRPISPILWICTKEIVPRFSEPIEVVIPHIFPELSEQDETELEIAFAKANHTTDLIQSDRGFTSYAFKEIEGAFPRLEGGKGTLKLHHCCYLCIQAKDISEAVTAKAAYCLSRYQSMSGTRASIIFCATYLLDTCLKALDEQFPVGSYIPHQCPHKFFKFHAAQNEKDDRFLFVSVESGEIQISANPKSCKILASHIDFWKHTSGVCGDDLSILHERRMYPPRIIFEVDCSAADVFQLTFNFSGCIESYSLDFELTFPLIRSQTPASSTQRALEFAGASPPFNISNLMILSNGECISPCTIIPHLTHKWKSIGLSLGLPYSTIMSLEKKNDDDMGRLATVIDKWINRGNQTSQQYQPSWEGLLKLLTHIEEGEKANEVSEMLKSFI